MRIDRLAGLTAAALLIATQAQAQAQAIYTGDCARVDALKVAKPMNRYFLATCTGIERIAATTPPDACGRASVQGYQLTQRSADQTRVIFDVRMSTLEAWGTTGSCPATEAGASNVSGTLTLQLAVEVCSLVVYRDYRLTQPGSIWTDNRRQRIVPLDSGGLAFAAADINSGRRTVIFNAQ